MNINPPIKPQAARSSPVSGGQADSGTLIPVKSSHAPEPTANDSPPYAELWTVIRAVLVVWALAVWLLLVMTPGIQQISDMASAMLHLPHMFIGLGLIGAIFAAYNLRSDGHLLWFLGVLLLLAGWM